MRGQWNLPPSSRLANRHRPVPSQKISFTLSARFARKHWPRIEDGVMRLSAAQMAALIEGLDWMRVHARRVAPEAVQ